MNLEEFGEVLRLSVSPSIIISACGLLMLSMTNRFGRAIDRARLLVRERAHAEGRTLASIGRQMAILRQRTRLIRMSIFFAALCILFTALEMLTLFVCATAGIDNGVLAGLLNILSLGCLCVAMLYFIKDITRSLEAMEADIDREEPVAE